MRAVQLLAVRQQTGEAGAATAAATACWLPAAVRRGLLEGSRPRAQVPGAQQGPQRSLQSSGLRGGGRPAQAGRQRHVDTLPKSEMQLYSPARPTLRCMGARAQPPGHREASGVFEG